MMHYIPSYGPDHVLYIIDFVNLYHNEVGFLLRLIGSDLHYIHIVRLDLEPVFLVLRV